MTVLQTVLSVVAVWAFLTVLVFGVVLIRKPLQSTRARVQHIAGGLRAIDRQTEPLAAHAERLAGSLGATAAALERLAGDLARAQRRRSRWAPFR